ncbi:MAG: radical SAM protein [bacterium]|nr:radical SAM protein [bacterium]
MFTPCYKELSRQKFNEKIEILEKMLESCILCPRKCKVNRKKGEKGFCRANANLYISSYGAHFGEEEILVGSGGSGTIFLTWCNLRCAYCQNYDISLEGNGEKVSIEQCAEIMLYLQRRGCHNINLVTPTHYTPHLIKSIKIASERGLNVPIVWNCGGYENVEVIKILEGIIDIYMPDIKYSNPETALKLSCARDYFERCKESVREMFRQVDNIQIENGIAKKGLLIRHLVLPEDLAGSEQIFLFIKNEISPDVWVNIMAQYRPFGNLPDKINRRISIIEYRNAINAAKSIGLKNILYNQFF